ncbi:MAG TPA: SGNH/GDSL hydrolase family protein [Vicinamibacterales bacterium]|nr:SGNH/GDSL hydrolase family protein [Vicinamibacterales bacterium]
MSARRLTCALLLLAAVSACSKESPTEPDNNTIAYTAIGASDANGVGSSAPCLGSCTTGQGYVPQLTRRMEQGGRTVTLSNLGIPTALLSPEFQQLSNAVGREALGNFLDGEVPRVPSSTTLLTVFAGANDANVVGMAIRAGLAGADVSGYIAARVQAFARDLRALLTGVRGRAPGTRIVFLNLPNLAGMPYAAGLSLDEKRLLQQIAVAFSAQVNTLVADGVLVADVMCDSRSLQSGIFSSDGFHPNDTGYAFLADLLYGPATTGSAPAPAASCSAMTLF